MSVIELSRERPDVLVVGAGNAALCTAISASEHGARVLMLEAAPFEERGGNSHFTGGAFRFAYSGVEDLLKVLPSMANEDLSNVDFGSYTEEQYFDDMFELTQYRTDQDLCEILVRNSLETAAWVHRQGVKLQPGLGRQAYKVDGKFKFWGGLALHIWGGGPEMLKALYATAEQRGVEDPLRDAGGRADPRARARDRRRRRASRRAGRDQGRRGRARLRQLRVEPGDARALSRAGLGARENPRHALQHGRRASPWRWRSARGPTAISRAAIRSPGTSTRRPMATSPSATSSRSTTIRSGSSSTPRASAMSTRALNFHSHTYAKYGGEIMRQPGMFAWQVFDAKAHPLLRGEYRIRRVTKAEADTLEELAPKLEGVDPEAFLRTVRAYNAACTSDVPFNPNILDGRSTKGLAIEKTNWAVALDTPPYHAYHVTTGVTFTFGGVKISKQGEVEDLYGRLIPGLYAAGEMVGGLFFHNYASGTGLMSGATFGRLAGRSAARIRAHGRRARPQE